MSIQERHQQLLDRYFDGSITPNEREELDKLLLEDIDLQKDFNTMRQTVEAIKAQGFREMLNGIQKTYFPEDFKQSRDS
ncbi:MAG: hypothetical protein QM762_17895 [Chryseolinea sp.]